MKLTSSFNEVLVPKFNDNEKLKPNEQVRVDLEALNAEERGRLSWYESDPATNKLTMSYDYQRLISQKVKKIHNLEDKDGKSIESGEDLLKCTSSWAWALIVEIRVHLFSSGESFSEEDEGKSK